MLKWEVERNAGPGEDIGAISVSLVPWRKILSRVGGSKERVYTLESWASCYQPILGALDELTPFVDQLDLPEVQNLYQPQALVGAVKPKTDAVGWQADYDWGVQGVCLGVVEVDGGVGLLVFFDQREGVM